MSLPFSCLCNLTIPQNFNTVTFPHSNMSQQQFYNLIILETAVPCHLKCFRIAAPVHLTEEWTDDKISVVLNGNLICFRF